jgi:hypothetical protein
MMLAAHEIVSAEFGSFFQLPERSVRKMVCAMDAQEVSKVPNPSSLPRLS